MNSVFTAKLLQNLRNKKGNKGFTLIELLVVVIIIGVLAAIALPNLLGQVAKGRQAEARNNLGAVNRAQQAHRLEEGIFGVVNVANVAPAATPPIELLPIGITGQYYAYDDNAAPTATVATVNGISIATYTNDILDYQAQVGQTAAGVFSAVICEESALTVNDQAADGTGAGCTAPSVPVN